jgi:hypothetical protein
MGAAVAAARKSVLDAGTSLGGSEKSLTAARALFDVVLPKIDALPLTSPVEMKLAVASIQEDMRGLRELLDDASGENKTARASLTAAGQKLEEATAERNETQAAAAAYIEATAKITANANASEVARAKDSKALLWYRLHWWLGWIVLIGGVLACITVAFLKFTGRLAAVAARV